MLQSHTEYNRVPSAVVYMLKPAHDMKHLEDVGMPWTMHPMTSLLPDM